MKRKIKHRGKNFSTSWIRFHSVFAGSRNQYRHKRGSSTMIDRYDASHAWSDYSKLVIEVPCKSYFFCKKSRRNGEEAQFYVMLEEYEWNGMPCRHYLPEMIKTDQQLLKVYVHEK